MGAAEGGPGAASPRAAREAKRSGAAAAAPPARGSGRQQPARASAPDSGGPPQPRAALYSPFTARRRPAPAPPRASAIGAHAAAASRHWPPPAAARSRPANARSGRAGRAGRPLTPSARLAAAGAGRGLCLRLPLSGTAEVLPKGWPLLPVPPVATRPSAASRRHDEREAKGLLCPASSSVLQTSVW